MKITRILLTATILTALILFVATRPTPSQDVMKVASDTHSVLLENDQVRVLAVHIKPGAIAPMHSHPASVVYILSDAKLKFTRPDGKTAERDLKAGTALWTEPTTHSAENIGTTDFQEIQVELKPHAM
jgi:quercetin dioxygenase-like cupin family protein